MADVFDSAKRSEVMSRIRSSGTDIEVILFAIARRVLGPHRRIVKNAKLLPGKPDVYVPALSLVIFADGCFFHGCPKHGHIPKTNAGYWAPKLHANQTRDRRNRRILRKDGLSVWRIWEHDLQGRKLQATTESLAKRLVARQMELSRDRESGLESKPETSLTHSSGWLIAAERRANYSAKSR